MPKATEFLATLRKGGLLLDGGMGTSLLGLGVDPANLAAACLSAPEMVVEVHRGFLDAGADVIQTHSFAANRLAIQGLGGELAPRALNLEAARIARAAVEASGSGWVAGNIGPAGSWAQPPGSAERADLVAAYEEQATALVAGGVDLFTLETFGDSAEACLALEVLRDCADLPILLSFTFIEREGAFLTLREEPLLEGLQCVQAAGADAVGVNCASGSGQTLACVRAVASELSVPFTAKPNAGIPVVGPDGLEFPQTPDQFARDMVDVKCAGVAAVGGCCGADARFILALARELAASDER